LTLILWCWALTINNFITMLIDWAAILDLQSLIVTRQFLPVSPQFFKSRNWPSFFIWNQDLGVCYRFIIPKVNHVAFRMRECFRNKVCINCWFLDYWIQKPNFYYGLVDLEWFFSIMDFWIWNAYFELRIDKFRMFFLIMNVLYFFFILD